MPSGSVARACARSASGGASPGRAGRIETGGGFLAGTLTDGSTRERRGRAGVGGTRDEIQRRIHRESSYAEAKCRTSPRRRPRRDAARHPERCGRMFRRGGLRGRHDAPGGRPRRRERRDPPLPLWEQGKALSRRPRRRDPTGRPFSRERRDAGRAPVVSRRHALGFRRRASDALETEPPPPAPPPRAGPRAGAGVVETPEEPRAGFLLRTLTRAGMKPPFPPAETARVILALLDST